MNNCGINDDWTAVDWTYVGSNIYPNNAADWKLHRLKATASARARAIQLADGEGTIDTEVSIEELSDVMGLPAFRDHGCGHEPAGQDADVWEGVPRGGKNDVRTYPLIFKKDGAVLRVTHHRDGFALYGRRYSWQVPFMTYSSLEELDEQLRSEDLDVADFECYGDVPYVVQIKTKQK